MIKIGVTGGIIIGLIGGFAINKSKSKIYKKGINDGISALINIKKMDEELQKLNEKMLKENQEMIEKIET